MTPKRIQLRRTKGWRLPVNTVNVARPGYFGNPFRVGVDGTAEECVRFFERALRAGVLRNFPGSGPEHPNMGWKLMLRGKNVACWCKPGDICHGDVLLRIANAEGKV